MSRNPKKVKEDEGPAVTHPKANKSNPGWARRSIALNAMVFLLPLIALACAVNMRIGGQKISPAVTRVFESYQVLPDHRYYHIIFIGLGPCAPGSQISVQQQGLPHAKTPARRQPAGNISHEAAIERGKPFIQGSQLDYRLI